MDHEDAPTCEGGQFREIDWELIDDVPVELWFDPDEELPFRIRVNGEIWESYADQASGQIAFTDVIRDLKASARDQRLVEKERRGL
jgi:hypothetical protein